MKKKIVSVCLVVCLLATAIIGTTLAYFTDEKAVTNTFTTGDVTIKLEETDVDTNGVATGDGRKEEGNAYHLLPGKTYIKDPIVTVNAGSEECYVFVRVNNTLSGIESNAEGYDSIADQMAANGWSQLNAGDETLFVYEATVTAPADEGVELPVFQSFTIDADLETVAEPGPIEIIAYAVQAEGFNGSAQDAWDATYGAPVEP